MDISNGRLGFTQDLDNQKFLNALRQSNRGVTDFNAHLQQNFNQSLISVNDLAKGVTAFLTIDMARDFVTQMVKIRGEFEQTEIAFNTMLQSREKGNALMKEMVELAKNTPMQFSEVSKGAKQLLAYQVEAEKLTETLSMLGDISSGLAVPISRLILVYGQVKAKGKLMGDDLRQFTEAGVPMIAMIAKNMGIAQSAVADMVSEGKVGFKDVEKVLQDLTNQGGLFYNMMEEQSKTIPGQIAKLQDEIEQMFNNIGKDSQGFVTSIIGGASSVVENYKTVGKTIGVLISAYGAYKTAVIVLNVIEKARLTTTLALGAAEGRVTAMQALRYVSTLKLTAAQTALNTTMMVNPYAIIISAVVALGTAYYFLADHTTAAEKAQEAYNKTQEDVKSKLDETKKKAEEYINIIRDETSTVYQQIQAYKLLQELKLKGFDKLSLEDIKNAKDFKELITLLNNSIDNKSLESQQKALTDIESQIKSIKSQIDNVNKSNGQGGLALDSLYKKLDVLNVQYNTQLSKVNEIDREMKFANMTLEQKRAYWENIISTTEKQISTIQEVNIKQNDTNNLANQVSNAFRSWDVSRLNFQLNEAQNQLVAINTQMTTAVPVVKNKPYWDDQKKLATESFEKALPGTKEWVEAKKKIDEANLALKAWDTSVKKTKTIKPKAPKKSDDPFEKYKKQIQSVKEDYERFVDYMNSDDLVLKNSGKIQYETLSKSGATYEEFLRRLQKQLANTSNKSALQVKQLRFINDELAKTIDFNAFDKFKEGIESSISESENLLEVLGKIQEEKLKLQGNTDQISVDKLKFLDEKEIENIKKADDAAKDLIKTLTEESKPLDAINKKFDAQLFLLKKKINDANEEISKLTISASSSPEGSDERIKIEEKILKLKKEILETQNLIDFNESKRTIETKNVTNNVDYNKLLSEYQSYEDKIKAIDDKMKADLLTNQTYYETQKKSLIQQGKVDELKALEEVKNAKEAQIKKQASDDTSGLFKDKLMNSDEWAMLFSNMDEMSAIQIDNLIKEIETKFNRLKGKFNPIDLNAILKQLRQARRILIEKNPFGELAKGFADLFTEAEAGTEKNTDSIVQKWDRVQKALDGSFEFIDDALKSTGALKEGLGETAKAGLQAVTTTISSALAIKATVKSAKEGISSLEKASVILAIISAALQIAQAIAKFLSNIFSKDKKKEKQIKDHQKAVDDLTNSYKDLEDAAKRALGSDVYSGQKQMIENLKQQQIEYQKMIELEKGKKKKDAGKIKEWEDALRDSKNTIQDILEEIAEDVVQTNAKDLATELGDSLVEAFGKGEDAAKSFAEVANNVLKNAVLNQLKKQFLEKQLQGALDKLYKDMGGDDEGNFNFNGLSPEEQQAFRDKIKEISQNFSSMLGEYSDLFKDLTDPNESALAGAIKGMSEETGNALLGQFNAMRILQKELVTINIDSNKILLKSLDRLANIDYNTRSVLPLLEKLLYRIDNAGRAYGF
ncbi:tape measure protein [Empedobacter falsenii]|uniref:tape measure protein n=1 Tax=Empedobacter falsenii TaxID=343874 RepID=UPI0025778960|nr:tape measure protein [Empedobacter falsenii]MDM1547374.1 tape measure protein [Empedobacter falsenii]